MLLLLVIVFFSFSIVITWDSTHYLTYVNIFEGASKFSTWDIVRGPVFPYIIYLGFLFFGKTIQGTLLLMFLFYLVYVLLVNYFCNILFRKKKVLKYIILLFCIFNPIIFGYYHTLLTEFVAVTLALLSCYFATKWWKVNTKKEKIIDSLYFIIALPFAWFLKQPYICCVLIPMCVSTLIALCNNHTKQKVLYYVGTCIFSVFFLAFSIWGWNKFLIYKGVNMNTGRDSSSMMSMQIIQGVQYFRYENNFDFENLNTNNYLSEEEKEYISKNLNDNKDNLRIISIYDNNKLIEQDVIEVDKNGIPSTKDAVIQIGKTFFKYPTLIIKNYIRNYCALSSVCKISTQNGVTYNVTNEFDFIDTFEHKSIAYKNYNYNSDNSFYFPEERQYLVNNLTQTTSIGILGHVENLLEIPTNIVFKITILLLPFALLELIVMGIIKRKKIINDNLYITGLILLSYSFLAVFANALSGAIIDRYVTAMFIPGLLGIIVATVLIIRICKNKNKIKE